MLSLWHMPASGITTQTLVRTEDYHRIEVYTARLYTARLHSFHQTPRVSFGTVDNTLAFGEIKCDLL
jgi:hypothetical protein